MRCFQMTLELLSRICCKDVAFLKELRIGINETITLKHVGHQSSVRKCNTVSFMIPRTAAACVEIYPS